jgi:methionyl-tRNA synthetase
LLIFAARSELISESKNNFMIQNPKDIRLPRHCRIRTDRFTLAIWRVYVPSDIYSRYLRLQGRDVCLFAGDEHGVAISMKAKRRHYATEVIDKYDGIIRKSFSDFGISFDNYSELRLKFIMIRLRNF